MGPQQVEPTAATVARCSDRHRNRRWTAAALVLVAIGMVGLTFAAVPLYRWFCQVTGYGGTTRTAAAAPAATERTITVRFDASTAAGMPWLFDAPEPVKVALGESALVTYRARNPTDRPILGTATFNVTPFPAGPYFNKIECFCFTEQLLMPGGEKEFPVTFFVDPAFSEDMDTAGLGTITLSYTFFEKGPAALEKYMAARGISSAKMTRGGGR